MKVLDMDVSFHFGLTPFGHLKLEIWS